MATPLTRDEVKRAISTPVVASICTIIIVCLPIFFSISATVGLSFRQIIASTEDSRYIGAYLFANIGLAGIWLPFYFFSQIKKLIERHNNFSWANELILGICLVYLLLIALYSAYLYGISISQPDKIIGDAGRAGRFLALTIIVHFYLDILFSVKTKQLMKLGNLRLRRFQP